MALDRKDRLFIAVGLGAMILLVRLFFIQIVDDRYKKDSRNNSIVYEAIFPPRGLIYDRNGNLLVGNVSSYDIIVTPRTVHEFDTLALADVLEIDTSYVREKMEFYRTWKTKIGFKPQVFLKQASPEIYQRFAEVQFLFPGFSGQVHTSRYYPYNAGGNLLGYVSEVDGDFIATNPEYRAGDNVGKTGIERARETQLRGKKGYRIFLRDSRNRVLTSYNDGKEDTMAEPGEDVHTTIDAELQQYGQELMKNKRGSLIAIEPSTGEILALVTSPCIDVDALADFGKYYSELAADPNKPMFNRPVAGSYPPGSVFKLVNGLIGLQEGVLKPTYKYPCDKGYYYTSTKKLGCHQHRSPLDFYEAVAASCNGYFCYVFKNIMDNKKYENTKEAFNAWEDYVRSFGFGSPLGSDIPNELGGTIPKSERYDKVYGHGHWNYSSAISLAIGQGEIGATPLQIANLSATMANRGWYITPHMIKDSPVEKHYTKIDRKHFETAVKGMYEAVNSKPNSGATATAAAVKGLDICGKTGTAENPHGADHSVFICFAPKDDPKIAVAAYIENAGFGSTWACPISSLLVEKYLNGEVARKDLEQYVEHANLLNVPKSASKKN